MVDRVTYLSTSTKYYVFDALYELAIKLPMARFTGIADSDTASTIVDADMPNHDELFDGGTLFLWFSTAAPDLDYKRSKVVTDHTGTTLTFEPDEALMDTIGYTVFDGAFPRHILIEAVSLALADFGTIPVVRNITTVTDQQEYDYTESATILTGNKVVKVELATETSAPYNYYEHHHWTMKHDPTIGIVLSFDPNHIPAGGYNMRVTYLVKHLDLMGHETYVQPIYSAQDALEIAPPINPLRLSWAAAVYALRWKMQMAPDALLYAAAYQEAVQWAEMYKQKCPILIPDVIHHSRWVLAR